MKILSISQARFSTETLDRVSSAVKITAGLVASRFEPVHALNGMLVGASVRLILGKRAEGKDGPGAENRADRVPLFCPCRNVVFVYRSGTPYNRSNHSRIFGRGRDFLLLPQTGRVIHNPKKEEITCQLQNVRPSLAPSLRRNLPRRENTPSRQRI